MRSDKVCEKLRAVTSGNSDLLLFQCPAHFLGAGGRVQVSQRQRGAWREKELIGGGHHLKLGLELTRTGLRLLVLEIMA